MESTVIILEDKYIIVKRDIGESIERMIERGYFIIKYMKENKTEYEETENLSRIWANIKFDKNKYNDTIHEKLKKFI